MRKKKGDKNYNMLTRNVREQLHEDTVNTFLKSVTSGKNECQTLEDVVIDYRPVQRLENNALAYIHELENERIALKDEITELKHLTWDTEQDGASVGSEGIIEIKTAGLPVLLKDALTKIIEAANTKEIDIIRFADSL